jgi:hypothetical protein
MQGMSMNDRNRISRWIGTFLAASLVVATAASAQKAGHAVLKGGQVSDVMIAVWGTGDDEVRLSLGDSLTLEAGEEVTLRAYAPRDHAPQPGRWYLPGTFSVDSGSRQVRLSDVNVAKGSCTLSALRESTGKPARISFRLANHIQVTQRHLRHGTVSLPIHPSSHRRPDLDESTGDGRTSDREMVRNLFQGILLRDPGEAGESFERKIRREGYEGVVDAAYDIVESYESQRLVLTRGHTNTERLEAIYRHLLDLRPSEIDHYQWRDHMEMMHRGDVTDVVMDIVLSPELRRVHGYHRHGQHDR